MGPEEHGGHCEIAFDGLEVSDDNVLMQVGDGLKVTQIRLGPARLTHCMRWLGAVTRAHEIATAYACRRQAFGKPLIDHEGVGFQLADNLMDLKQAELMIDWCAGVLDTGAPGGTESSVEFIRRDRDERTDMPCDSRSGLCGQRQPR
jgi:acyl-CoA dehydrogenase